MNEDKLLLEQLEMILNESDLEKIDKATAVLRLAGIQLSDINAESLEATFGEFRVSINIQVLD